jgi:lysophospholipase L1-like esterase
VEKGDAKWIDARGSWMAGILAGPVYRLLGKSDFGVSGDYLTEPMPAVNQLVGGELAWRQHDGGHEVTPNWPAFFDWVAKYIPTVPFSKSEEMYRVPADQPSPRTDQNSLAAHGQMVDKAKKGGIDLYFLGDSITRRWGTSDEAYKEMYANWKENFFGWNAANFGWGGDTTQSILWRIQNGELYGVNPKVIVLLAGTNNLGTGGNSKDVIAGNRAILKVCRAKAPRAKIVLMGILPRDDNPALITEIEQANRGLARLANGDSIRFLDITRQMVDRQGKLLPGIAVDGLHLAVKGYQEWADALNPILTDWLGVRAKSDTAPPPTGDPSVVKPPVTR